MIAKIPVLFQRLVDDPFELCGKIRIQPDRRGRRLVQDRIEYGRRGRPAKRRLSGGHLVQHDAEGEKVGARIQFLSEGLFGRHVGDGAERCAGTGQHLLGRPGGGQGVAASCSVSLRRELGQAEIQDLGVAVAR